MGDREGDLEKKGAKKDQKYTKGTHRPRIKKKPKKPQSSLSKAFKDTDYPKKKLNQHGVTKGQ